MIELKINVDHPHELLTTLATLTTGLLAGASQVATGEAPVARGHTAAEAEAAHAAVQAQVDGQPIEGEKPKRQRRTKEQIAADEAAAAAVAGAAQQSAEGNSGTTSAPTAQTQDGSTATQTSAPADAASSASDATLDFDKDVAPTVLRLVKERGKPWVSNILEQFGVTRASELSADRWGELLTALNDADAA